MALTSITLFLILLIPCNLPSSGAQTWIKGGYWYYDSGFPVSDINSALFTHLICAYADLNSSTYQLSIPSANHKQFSNFTNTVKQKNPQIVTLLSISGGLANSSDFNSMISQSSYRKPFIDSSIRTARSYGFHGLDFNWFDASSASELAKLATLFQEWRAAIEAEPRNSNTSKLILTMAVWFSPNTITATFPIESMRNNLDWLHVMAYAYRSPTRANFTGASAALYDPATSISTDYGVNEWINGGFPSTKLVLGLPFYGYAWTLVNPNNNEIGAPAKGPAKIIDADTDGLMTYKAIKYFIQRNGAVTKYNATYVMNYCSVGSSWIGFDDVEVVKNKVSYARENNLLGYYAWRVTYDDHNWVLSQAAAGEHGEDHGNTSRRLLKILVPVIAIAILVLVPATWYLRKRGSMYKGKESQSKLGTGMLSEGNTNDPSMLVFHFNDIVEATDNFSFENKLGEGGYGPVYKAKLKNGQEIAVKRLSKTSKQGYEEFKNEVMLTARLQHVNLVRVLGFCVERDEQMLIYEYMINKSLDYYIYDPIRRLVLNWEKRVQIIEGVVQGLLYLQEYSRFTIIHRDLKASNILLDSEMKAKISDFGMARIFQKEDIEANTSRIVGTYGYIPPEYVQRGIYSTKSDVYSFGVLLLQIISGKPNNCCHGLEENLNLLEYAYELWKEGKCMEFTDPSLDDTNSSCKLMRCMQIALLCVQENPAERPSMPEVSSMLINETISMNALKRPAFSVRRDEGQVQRSPLQQETWSVDNASITQLVAR
ncbi:cysteine-rich receptor-like protein kinase 7 [Diospyros lotus]|uniref:cysteine-rich receptor-like protein kinase 7 n=1 Tax=Diospyros lotus TaxID=55363 RepID=UPI00224F5B5C|nr:cysteine-rich receptor-like protein kinase 7 [Diospyros lotus]